MKLKDEFKKLESKKRLHGIEVPVIALTGGIATGKSTVSNELIKKGFPVICADKLVKEIYASNEAFEFINTNFPSAIKDKAIDFKTLREIAFSKDENRERLESFIYSHMPELFRVKTKEFNSDYVIYDVPLLFEKGLDKLVDTIVTVYAPRDIQVSRIQKRDQTGLETIEKILGSQWDIEKKKDQSDVVIENVGTKKDLKENIEALIQSLFY